MKPISRAWPAVAVVFVLLAACGGGGSGPAPGTAIREALTVEQSHELVTVRTGDPTFVILDVRTPAEFAGGHLEGAVNVDVNSGSFPSDVGAMERSDAYLVYCHAGTRSAQAVDVMVDLGFQELYDMLGGITAWTGAGYATVP